MAEGEEPNFLKGALAGGVIGVGAVVVAAGIGTLLAGPLGGFIGAKMASGAFAVIAPVAAVGGAAGAVGGGVTAQVAKSLKKEDESD